jgi:phage gpG-like protein
MMELKQFARMLETRAIPAAASVALDAAAAVIESEAKAEIGTYQRSDMGPFQPWAELKDATKLDRVRLGFTPNDPLLRTGDLRNSISREVHGIEAVVGSDSDVMVYQELGTRTIPPRSVLGLAASRKTQDVLKLVGESVQIAFLGGTIKTASPPKLPQE